MIILTSNCHRLAINIEYTFPVYKNKVKRVTTVSVYDATDPQTDFKLLRQEGIPLSCGVSRQHTKDRDIKKVARKQALSRALKALELQEEESSQLWESYFSQVKDH